MRTHTMHLRDDARARHVRRRHCPPDNRQSSSTRKGSSRVWSRRPAIVYKTTAKVRLKERVRLVYAAKVRLKERVRLVYAAKVRLKEKVRLGYGRVGRPLSTRQPPKFV